MALRGGLSMLPYHPPRSLANMHGQGLMENPSARVSAASQMMQEDRCGIAFGHGRFLGGLVAGLLAGAARKGLTAPSDSRVIVRGRNYEKNIKNQKGKAEAQKAKLKDRHLKKIIVSVREAGPDEDDNPVLKRLIRAALKDNVPRSTIENRIKKFLSDGETVVEISMAGYGPAGTAVVVDCVGSSAVNIRTDVNKAFKQVGMQVGNDGCNDHMFNKQGVLRFTGVEEESLFEASLEAEVEDVVMRGDEDGEVITLPEKVQEAVDVMTEQGFEPASFDVVMAPVTETELNEEQTYELKRLLHFLNEVDDVQDVHHNGKLQDGVELVLSNYGIPLAFEKVATVKN